MRGLFKRWGRGQSVEKATATGNITLISQVQGSVTITDGPVRPVHDPAEALARYAARVRQRYGRLDLAVLTPLHEQDEHPAVRLHDVFVPQSVRADPPPVELPQELLRRLMDPEEAQLHELPPGVDRDTVQRVRRAYQERPPLPVLDVLAGPGHDRLVVLGHPGAGKSTLARYLALALTAAEPQPGLEPLHGRLPLIVELREYAQAEWRERSFEDYLEHQYATEGLGLPRDLLLARLEGEQSGALVVFDGLDELFETGVRDAVTRRVAGFAARYPRTRIVVTSRAYGYQRAVLDGAGFADFMLQDLDREQIGAFTERWFALACPEDAGQARKLTDRVLTAVDGSASVRELAGNPLLLTILAIIGRRRELPRDRRAVYEHAVAVLVEHWDPSRYLKDRRVEEHLPYLGPEDKLELLRLIARRMQEGHGGMAGNHIAGPDLIRSFEAYLKERYELPTDRATVAARIMLDQFRGRNFVLSRFGGEIYGFVHRTFLEYLTAVDIAHRFNHERAVSEEELRELFARKAEDPAWHETLLLLVGLLDERFVAGVIERLLAPMVPARRLDGEDDRAAAGLPFAARCLAEVRRPGLLAAQADLIVRRLIRLLELCREYDEGYDANSPGLTDIAQALAGLGEHASARRHYLEWHDAWCRGNGTERRAVYRGVGMEAAEIRLHLLRAGPEPWAEAVRREALHSPDPSTRVVAALTAVDAGLPEAWELVREVVGRDPHPAVRETMAEQLGYDPEPGLETVPFLLGRLRDEADRQVRAGLLAALTRAALEAPEAHAWLLRALREGDAETRLGAVRGITLNQMTDPDIQSLLVRAARDGTPDVRLSAMGAVSLFPGADGDRELLGLALAQAEHDERAGVRLAALEALARLSDRHPEVRPVVLDRVRHDPAPDVRGRIVEVVGRERVCRDEAPELFLDLALGDADPEVRAEALRAWRFASMDGAEAITAVVALARVGETPRIRTAAVGLLLRFEDPEVTDLVERLAAADEGPEVRAALLAPFLGRAERERGTRLVRGRAVHDPSPVVRAAALDLLRERRRGLATLDLARQRAVDDEDPDVRITALRVLADAGRDDPRTLDLLRTATDRDASADVRAMAARLLAILGRGQPEG
ncbi:HEAT repeat domain-containing protein [Streptomyces sp. NPDC004267]|uniref:HEAT repeat domain-containing protein n=1 Tax=Streptomyces sp. NPDC004267 TaxID=3364694 RepID=UPI0036762E45